MTTNEQILESAIGALDSFILCYRAPEAVAEGLRAYLRLRITRRSDEEGALHGANVALREALEALKLYRENSERRAQEDPHAYWGCTNDHQLKQKIVVN